MDWQIKTIARKSALTEEPFKPGDLVACLIFKDEQAGELGRADVLPDEVEDFEIPGPLLGRWTRVIKDPDDDSENRRMVMASAEDFFMSLFSDSPADDTAEAELHALQHLLALMLERKRVLRALGPRQLSGKQLYVHVKTKQELEVPIVEISTDLMLKIENTLGDIIL
ncbi:MAG: hypothetical protein ACPGKS_02710 [Coraliomargarita sp.]